MHRRVITRTTLGLLMMLAASLACNMQIGSKEPTANAVAAEPSVVFIAPDNNSVIAEGTELTLAVSGTSNNGISKIDFQVDDAPIGSQTPTSPDTSTFTARQTWVATGVQGHFITAVLFDKDGKAISDAKMTITIVTQPSADAGSGTESGVASANTPTLASQAAPTSAGPTLIPTNTPRQQSGAGGAPTLIQGNNAQPATPERAVTIVIAPNNQAILKVKAPNLNIRGGDGITFPIIGAMKTNDIANIIGRNAASTWWFIQKDQTRGWVIGSTDFSEVTGDTSKVPVVASPPTPAATVAAATAVGAATSTPASGPDLVFDSVSMNTQNPKVNDTFVVTIVIRNQGTADAGNSLAQGVFQPGNETSPVAVPAIPAGQKVTVTMPVTLKQAGNNQTGVITLDKNGDIAEGANGEANNTYTTASYNVTN
jgi:hypothetical protein